MLRFTWVQVSEAVQSQALKVKTHFQLERDGLDECLGKQPAVLQSGDSANTHTEQPTENNMASWRFHPSLSKHYNSTCL